MLKQELISPSFGLDQWLVYSRREVANGFSTFKKKVFAKDSNTCFYCGFKATHGMKVINLDGNYYNNTMSNLFTSCPLCFWSCFVEHANTAGKKRGLLIHMPEISQARINGIVHAVFCSVSATTVHEKTAETMYKSMKLRAKTVESIYGEGRSDPTVFGKMVINALNVDGKIHERILKDLRFLPDMSAFADDIKAWSQEAAQAG